VRARGDRDLRGTEKSVAPEPRGVRRHLVRFLDLVCAGAIFLLAIVASMFIPKTYSGRIWIFGTDLALLFAAMLNLLRIQNESMRGVKAFCITANFAMTAFFVVLLVSMGLSRMVSYAPIPGVAVLLVLETAFSVRKSE
jgi:hypothetical protein